MIASHKRDYFGGLSSEVWSKSFGCLVHTAKESIFNGETTVVFEILGSGKVPYLDHMAVLKILYENSTPKAVRRQWHGRIVEYLDRLAAQDESVSLYDAIMSLHGFLDGQDGIENIISANI